MTASLISEGTFIIFNRLADNKKETGELGQNMYNKYQLFSLLKSHTSILTGDTERKSTINVSV